MLYRYNNTTCCTVKTTQHAVPLQQHYMLYRYSNTTCCTVTATQHAVPLQQHYMLYRYSNTTYCTVTATQHAVPLQQHNMLYCSTYSIYWCFIVCYILYTPTFLYNVAVSRPLFTRSQSTNTGRITNGTMAHSYSTALLGCAVPLCTVTLRFN